MHYVGNWEGGWALEVESFLGPVKGHRAERRVPFGAQKIYKKVNRTDFNYLCTYILYSPAHNVLDACISITASWRGLGPGIREFWAL